MFRGGGPAAWTVLASRGTTTLGELLVFPVWRVIARAEGRSPGEPVCLVDPTGRRVTIDEILRRRLVARSDPAMPVHHEYDVVAGGRTYRLSYVEGDEVWSVQPL